jgi:hypothetical protein
MPHLTLPRIISSLIHSRRGPRVGRGKSALVMSWEGGGGSEHRQYTDGEGGEQGQYRDAEYYQ